jgi:hypothetical protein
MRYQNLSWVDPLGAVNVCAVDELPFVGVVAPLRSA